MFDLLPSGLTASLRAPTWLRSRTAQALLGLGLASAALATPAFAVNCADLPNPIYGTGGSAQKPFLAKYGKALSGLPSPITLIYAAPGACVFYGALTDPAKNPIKGTVSYWGTDGKEQNCDLPVDGVKADFGVTGVFATSCAGVTALPANIGDFAASVISWNFIVPIASTQQVISKEAAYFVFGFGTAGQVAPWTDEKALAIRNATSAATLAISAAIGVPPGKIKGIDAKSNQGSVTAVTAIADPETAIGYVSGDVADANRKSVRTLAYQHEGQTCGYWPDSSATAFDKQGVRDGEYFLWSQNHFFAPIDNTGKPTNPLVAKVIGWFTGALPPADGVNVLDIGIATGNVPECALHVWREGDLAPLQSHQPKEPCDGYFEFKATGTTTHTVCAANTDCKDAKFPTCRFGYCEVQ